MIASTFVPGGERGVVMSISIPNPPTSEPRKSPFASSVPSKSQGAASWSVMTNGACRSPSSFARYWTPSMRASGRPSVRHWAIRRIAFSLRSTFQKKLFAESRIRRPPSA